MRQLIYKNETTGADNKIDTLKADPPTDRPFNA